MQQVPRVNAEASMDSEIITAAAVKLGEMRHDSFALLPFASYHMADYFNHWLIFGRQLSNPPHIFHVKCFRHGPEDQDFDENTRILKRISSESPIGCMP
jgi:phosphoenolpyruvate carboxykinase (GTP)